MDKSRFVDRAPINRAIDPSQLSCRGHAAPEDDCSCGCPKGTDAMATQLEASREING